MDESGQCQWPITKASKPVPDRNYADMAGQSDNSFVKELAIKIGFAPEAPSSIGQQNYVIVCLSLTIWTSYGCVNLPVDT